MHPLVDIGANLTHNSFDPDRDEVIARALAAGVGHMIVTGSSVAESDKAIRLAASRPGELSATAGVHPHYARDMDADSIPRLATLMASEHAVAVGECGLDYFRNFSSHHEQQTAFEAQLALAARLKKPVFLHQRDAHEDFLAILRPWREQLPCGVAHCFTGGRKELHDCLDLGLHIGITGWICDERRGQHLREIVGDIPQDRLLIETDAPYLLPRDLDPKPKTRRNEPLHLPHILQVVALCRGQDPEVLAAQTASNAVGFFGLQLRG